MKIAIIGAGFTGCSIALKLSEKHQVSLFEKEKELEIWDKPFCVNGFGLWKKRFHNPYQEILLLN